jgi:hypothetical protein
MYLSKMIELFCGTLKGAPFGMSNMNNKGYDKHTNDTNSVGMTQLHTGRMQ